MEYILQPVIFILLFPWRLVLSAEACSSSYTQNNFKIAGHVIKVLLSSSPDHCLSTCSSTAHCHSINFEQSRKNCELNRANHLSHPESFVLSDGSLYMNNFKRPLANCSDKLCGSAKKCLIKNDGQSYQCSYCQDALGMEDNRINDSSITASKYQSFYNSKYGRLRSSNWTVENGGGYLYIDLGNVTAVTKIATQGSDWGATGYVERYSVAHSTDKTTWVHYVHNATTALKGNTDGSTVVTNPFNPILKARFVRIEPTEWTGALTLRVELYGCLLA